MDGLARTMKPKASAAPAKANKTQAMAKASLVEAKARAIERGKGRKGRKDIAKWRGTKTNKKHNSVNNTQSGRTRDGIAMTTGLTQTGGRATGAQICGMILHGNRRQDNLPSMQLAQEQSNPTQGGSISMLGGLTMCELSVDDEEQ